MNIIEKLQSRMEFVFLGILKEDKDMISNYWKQANELVDEFLNENF